MKKIKSNSWEYEFLFRTFMSIFFCITLWFFATLLFMNTTGASIIGAAVGGYIFSWCYSIVENLYE